MRRDAPELTALDQTSFGILGATTRDDRRRIVELAEEASLSGDSEACARARADLTNPRIRLAAEVAWLSGISPRRVHAYRVLLKHDLDSYLSYTLQEAPLVQANLIAAALDRLDPDLDKQVWSGWIRTLAKMVDEIHAPHVLKAINEDRSAAGFPEVQSVDLVEEQLTAQRRHLTGVVQEVLDRLPTQRMIEMVASVVEQATDAGGRHAPLLIDEVIDRFAIGVQGFLEKEAENVRTLVKTAEDSAPKGKHVVDPLLGRLEQVVRNWLVVARPIQVSMKARGIEHDQSRALGHEIRNLGIRLYNNHGMLQQAQRLFELLRTAFAELPELAEKIGEDAATLSEHAAHRQFEDLMTPLLQRCLAATEAAEAHPSSADQEGQAVLSAAPKLLSPLETSRAPAQMVAAAKDAIAIALLNCAIAFGNKTSKWKPCINLLEASLRYATDAKVREHVGKNLEIVRKNDRAFGDLEPIASAPSLTTINGIGCTLYGNTDHDAETGSYLSTYYFALLAVPIFPICRYRVIPTGTGYRFLGKAPLRTFDKLHIAVSVGVLLWIFASL